MVTRPCEVWVEFSLPYGTDIREYDSDAEDNVN